MSAPSAPVTVSITRNVDPERVPEVTRWVQAGVRLASTWPGFLGSGWVRTSAHSREWHMLYRFQDAAALEAWDTSAERAEWLETGTGLVEDRQVRRRTGIEGWFDTPTAALDLSATQAGRAEARPPRWKQAVSIWLGFFPVNLAFTLLAVAFIPSWNDLWTLAKVLVTTVVLTPVMAYWVLPLVTRMLKPWLTAPAQSHRA